MDEEVIKPLATGNYDLLEVHDYSSLSPLPPLPKYRETILIAWSLGVYAAANSKITADLAIAINGTLYPVDQQYGIAPEIFSATITNWHEKGRHKFNRRMCGDRETLAQFTSNAPRRSIIDQQQELKAIAARTQNKPCPRNIFDVALVSNRDRIIPPAAQLAYWNKEQCPIISLEAPHYPFNLWNSWKELIDFVRNR